MKKKVLAIALVTVFTGTGVAQAADVTAQAVATWSATAKKDTTSKLVVTPLGSLAFQYAEGIKGFNSQKGLFDVAIEGDSTATAFKLTSRLITNTLTQLDTSGSTLNVGVDYNGAAVEKTGDTVMIDTANGVLGGNLSPLANGYNASNRTTAQDGFTFSIISGTTNGTTAVTDYSTLPEGIWSGDVSVHDAQRDNANRSAVATASARIGTILVVAPRQANYHFQYANGSLTNTGNATLRILAYGPCLKAANGKECKENYYLMPGKSRRFTRVDTADNKGRVALWQGDKFIPVK
ncbi:hypothetical protein A9R53_13875 [Escherichia coli]|nr:hypothetical protein A9R53_13875 [Escherichia coli]